MATTITRDWRDVAISKSLGSLRTEAFADLGWRNGWSVLTLLRSPCRRKTSSGLTCIGLAPALILQRSTESDMRASQVTACTLAAIAWGLHDSAAANPPASHPSTAPQSASSPSAPVTTVAPPEASAAPESFPERSPESALETIDAEALADDGKSLTDTAEPDTHETLESPALIESSSDRPAADAPLTVPAPPAEPLADLDPAPTAATDAPVAAPAPISSIQRVPAALTPLTALTRLHPGSALRLPSALGQASAESNVPATRNICGRSPRPSQTANRTIAQSAGHRFNIQAIASLDQMVGRMAGVQKTMGLAAVPSVEPVPASVQVATASDRRCPFPKFTTTKVVRFSSVRPAMAAAGNPAAGWRFPLPIAAPITSGFGWRLHPVSGDRRFHEGIDFGAAIGTPVFSARSGQVKTTDWLGGYGLTVVVDHGEYQTLYAHLSDIVVEPGSRVEAGTILGKVGNTGNSTGPHLHFEIRQRTSDGWLAIDPAAIAAHATPAVVTVAARSGLDNASLPTVAVAGTTSTPSNPRSPNTDDSQTIPVANAQHTLPTPPTVPTVRPDRIAELPDSITTQVPALNVSNLESNLGTVEPLPLETIEDWVAACRRLAEQGQYGRALAACDRAIALQPRQIGPWFARGQVLMQLGRYEDAIAAYDYVLTREPNQSLVLTERCNAYRGAGDLQKALTDCDRALDINLNWGDRAPLVAHQTRGIILLQQERYADAIAAFDTILADTPNHSLALTLRGRAHLELGNLDAALTDSDRALEVDQQWESTTAAVGWYHRALVLTEQQQYEDAIAAYEQAVRLEPNYAAAWANHGMLLLYDGRPSDALLSLQQATQLNPDASLAWLHQADALNQLGQHDPALAATQHALAAEQSGDSAKLWIQRAAAHVGLNQPDRALAAADRAVNLAPNEPESWVQRAIALEKLDRLPEALTAVNHATELDATHAHAWLTHGRLLHHTGQPTEAIAAYHQALKHATSSQMVQDSLHYRSLAYQILGQLDEALADRDRLVSLAPRSTDAWYQRAGLLLAMDRYNDAIAAYDQVLTLNPSHANAWAERGMALRFLGDEDGALVSFERAEQVTGDR